MKEGERSFSVGQAAGRQGDFADTDRKMAINIQWDFFTLEDESIKFKALNDHGRAKQSQLGEAALLDHSNGVKNGKQRSFAEDLV